MTAESSEDGGSPLPKRKSRLRRKTGRRGNAPNSGNSVVPLTHFLPKNWLVLWGAGLFCLATVSLLPIFLLEASTPGGFGVDTNHLSGPGETASHGVHKLIQVANEIRNNAKKHLRPVSTNNNNNNNNNDKKNDKPKIPSVAEKQAKPHYTIKDLPLDTTDWQAKPVARGVAGRPMDLTPALQGAQRAHIECDIPVDSLAYWNDPVGQRDLQYTTPFRSKHLSPGKIQYITFTPDRGGWNNVRMSMEIIFVLAAATGRTLVLPPKEPLYLLNKDAGDKQRGFADFFPLDKLPIKIITMKEFLEREAGKLFEIPADEKERTTLYTAAEACEKRAKAAGPCTAVSDFLDKIGHNPGVSSSHTCLIFDKDAMESAPSDEAYAEAAEHCGKRKTMFWNSTLAEYDILHFPAGQKEYRLLTHFYNMIFFSDPVESHHYKRFVRDYLRYQDSIFCAAGKVIQAVQLEGKSRGFEVDEDGAGGYSALHVRRGDLQYKKVKIPAAQWYENTKEIWQEKEILYVATDERNKTFFDDLAIHYDLRFLDDYWDMAQLGDLDPNYMGMIDTIVASRGRAFAGTFFSTFTGYINRLRGYYGMTMKNSWYSFLPKKTRMHEWTTIDYTAFAFEWPEGWAGIDADVWPEMDVF